MSKSLQFDAKAQQFLDSALESSDSVFLTWKAWTGKTTLLQHFLATTEKQCVVLAPTWVAALHVWGQTIHSFFQFSTWVTIAEAEKKARARLREDGELFSMLDVLVIDEISMVRADMFDCIDRYLRIVKMSPEPFGGAQLILVGDLFQLAPIVSSKERVFFSQTYASSYFFSAHVVVQDGFRFSYVELERVHRQEDNEFVRMLNGMRVNQTVQADLDALNTRVVSDWSIDEWTMFLAAKNKTVDEINIQQLIDLPWEPRVFTWYKSSGFSASYFPTAPRLTLKVWAQVMFVVNGEERVNGTLWKVVAMDEEEEIVSVQIFDGPVVDVWPHTWKVTEYHVSEDEEWLQSEEVGSFTQLPLKLARACTIHKAQWKTFERLIVDVEWMFAHGQAYVALSRCRSLEWLHLVTPLQLKDIKTDWHIVKFFQQLHLQSQMQQLSHDNKMQLIKQAIDQQNDLSVTYMNGKGEVSERTVTPMRVWKRNYRWFSYIGVLWDCHETNKQMVFDVEKILDVNVRSNKKWGVWSEEWGVDN